MSDQTFFLTLQKWFRFLWYFRPALHSLKDAHFLKENQAL